MNREQGDDTAPFPCFCCSRPMVMITPRAGWTEGWCPDCEVFEERGSPAGVLPVLPEQVTCLPVSGQVGDLPNR
jgi:hypothetical protein